jgi:hypothetical protein
MVFRRKRHELSMIPVGWLIRMPAFPEKAEGTFMNFFHNFLDFKLDLE